MLIAAPTPATLRLSGRPTGRPCAGPSRIFRGCSAGTTQRFPRSNWSAIVGRLTARQRQAVRRAACSDDAQERRLTRRIAPDHVAGKELMIDGFNVLTTIEAALGGAVVIVCRDTTCRDIAGIHGGYRKVAETEPALEQLIMVLTKLSVGRCHWLFDRPVSNSGRIRGLVQQKAAERSLDWSVDLVDNPDPILSSLRRDRRHRR